MSSAPSTFGHHDHVELVADGRDQREEVVEGPRRVEAVDAGPQLRVAEVDIAADLHQALAGRDLVVGLDRVLEVAEEDVDLGHEIRHLGRHLLVARVEEVDHPRRSERHVVHRLRCADGERSEEVLGGTHRASRHGSGCSRTLRRLRFGSKGGATRAACSLRRRCRAPRAPPKGSAMFEWSEEQLMVRDAVRQFIDKEIAPQRRRARARRHAAVRHPAQAVRDVRHGRHGAGSVQAPDRVRDDRSPTRSSEASRRPRSRSATADGDAVAHDDPDHRAVPVLPGHGHRDGRVDGPHVGRDHDAKGTIAPEGAVGRWTC